MHTRKGILSILHNSNSLLSSETHNRKDIQGLRAVAILTVLFAHANFPLFAGGFVGVDIFFVISGFLITGILIKEYSSQGRISISNFYARRARRIIPAATIVIIATVILSTIILGREGSVSTYWEAIWSSLFVNNWYMAFVGVDYFSLGATPSPLQHFWSLAVEEQFYLIWPTLIILLAFFAKKTQKNNLKVALTIALTLIIIASLTWSIYQTNAEPTIAYFSTLTRVWELAVGALLAVVAHKITINKTFRTVALYAGLIMIMVAVFGFNENTSFPGYAAILPIFGATLVLLSGTNKNANFNQILTNKFMVWIGGISYALYLWHWPMLILWETKTGEKPSFFIALCLIIISTLLAWVSTTFIEDPLRLSLWWKSRKILTNILGLVLIISTIALSYALIPASALREINKMQFVPLAAALENVQKATLPNTQTYINGTTLPELALIGEDRSIAYDDNCHIEHTDPTILTTCIYGDTKSGINVAVLGDSHASMWLSALNLWGIKNNIKITLFAKSECPAAEFTPYSNILKRAYYECKEWRAEAINTIIGLKPQYVILASAHQIQAVNSDGEPETSKTVMDKKWSEGYTLTADKFKEANIPVIILGDAPGLGKDSATCIKANKEDASKCSTKMLEETETMIQRETLASTNNKVPYIKVVDLFCYENTCPNIINNKVVYMDGTHITKTYSEYLAGSIGERLNEFIKK